MRPTLDFHHAPLCFTILRCLHTSRRPVLDADFVRSAHLVYCNCCIGSQRHDKHKSIAISAVGMSSLGLYKESTPTLNLRSIYNTVRGKPFCKQDRCHELTAAVAGQAQAQSTQRLGKQQRSVCTSRFFMLEGRQLDKESHILPELLHRWRDVSLWHSVGLRGFLGHLLHLAQLFNL